MEEQRKEERISDPSTGASEIPWQHIPIDLTSRKVTTKMAVEILQKNGLPVTETDAQIILDFLYKFANIAVAQYFKYDNR